MAYSEGISGIPVSEFIAVRKTPQCHGLKEIDSIWVILKDSKSWGEKKEERKLDTSRKRYVRAANTNTLVKQTPNHAHDLVSKPASELKS